MEHEELMEALILLGIRPAAGDAVCASCGRKSGAKFACSRCHHAVYCNAECQRSDWRRHKAVCQRAAALHLTADAPFPPFRIRVPSGADVVAELVSVNVPPPPADLESNVREFFLLENAAAAAADAADDAAADADECDEEDGDGGIGRLQQVISQRTAQIPPSVMPLAGVDDLVERVRRKDDPINVDTLAFTVPLMRPATVRLKRGDGKLLTRADVAVCVARVYSVLYAADEAANQAAFGISLPFENLSLHSILQVAAPDAWIVVVDT